MLGWSLSKLVVLVAIIAAVWYGFKYVGRLDKNRKAQAKSAIKAARRAAAGGGSDGTEPTASRAEDMVRCAACGDFVSARHATGCGRDDCPYPG